MLSALTAALSAALATCGGGEIGANDSSASTQSETGLEGRARALSAGTSKSDTALTESAAAFVPAASRAEAEKSGAPNGRAGDLLGWSACSVGSRVVVGSPQQRILFRGTNTQGAAYMFDESGAFVRALLPTPARLPVRSSCSTRRPKRKRANPSRPAPGAIPSMAQGSAVPLMSPRTGSWWARPEPFIDGAGTIGDHGAIHLYHVATRRLIARATPPGARAKNNLGPSVGVEGRTFIAGAPFDSIAAAGAGAADVFTASNDSLRLKLTAADRSAEDRFRFAVSTSGGVIAVGSPVDDDAGSAAGSVYLFNATTSAFVCKIVASDAGING